MANIFRKNLFFRNCFFRKMSAILYCYNATVPLKSLERKLMETVLSARML